MTKEEAEIIKEAVDRGVFSDDWEACRFCWMPADWDKKEGLTIPHHRDDCLYVRALEIIDANTDSE